MEATTKSVLTELSHLNRVKGQRFFLESSHILERFSVSTYKSLTFQTPDSEEPQYITIISSLPLRADNFTIIVSGATDAIINPITVMPCRILYLIPANKKIKIQWK